MTSIHRLLVPTLVGALSLIGLGGVAPAAPRPGAVAEGPALDSTWTQGPYRGQAGDTQTWTLRGEESGGQAATNAVLRIDATEDYEPGSIRITQVSRGTVVSDSSGDQEWHLGTVSAGGTFSATVSIKVSTGPPVAGSDLTGYVQDNFFADTMADTSCEASPTCHAAKHALRPGTLLLTTEGRTPEPGRTEKLSTRVFYWGPDWSPLTGRAVNPVVTIALGQGLDPASVRVLSASDHHTGTLSGLGTDRITWRPTTFDPTPSGDPEGTSYGPVKELELAVTRLASDPPSNRPISRAWVLADNQPLDPEQCLGRWTWDFKGDWPEQCDQTNWPTGAAQLKVGFPSRPLFTKVGAPAKTAGRVFGRPGDRVVVPVTVQSTMVDPDDRIRMDNVRLELTWPPGVTGPKQTGPFSLWRNQTRTFTVAGTLSRTFDGTLLPVTARAFAGDDTTPAPAPAECVVGRNGYYAADDHTADTDSCDRRTLVVRRASAQVNTWKARFTTKRGPAVRYYVRVRNTGQTPLTQAHVYNAWPAGTRAGDIRPVKGLYAPTGFWKIGTLGVGRVRTLTVTQYLTPKVMRAALRRHTVKMGSYESPYRGGRQVNGTLAQDTDQYDSQTF